MNNAECKENVCQKDNVIGWLLMMCKRMSTNNVQICLLFFKQTSGIDHLHKRYKIRLENKQKAHAVIFACAFLFYMLNQFLPSTKEGVIL